MTRYNGSVFCVLESSFHWKQTLPMPKEWYPCPRETTHKPFERKKKGMCKRAQNYFVHPCIGVVLGALLTSLKPRVLCQWLPPRSSSAVHTLPSPTEVNRQAEQLLLGQVTSTTATRS